MKNFHIITMIFCVLFMLLPSTVLAQQIDAARGCGKDTDCKGDRICERGECIFPNNTKIPINKPEPEPIQETKTNTPRVDPFDLLFSVLGSLKWTAKSPVRSILWGCELSQLKISRENGEKTENAVVRISFCSKTANIERFKKSQPNGIVVAESVFLSVDSPAGGNADPEAIRAEIFDSYISAAQGVSPGQPGTFATNMNAEEKSRHTEDVVLNEDESHQPSYPNNSTPKESVNARSNVQAESPIWARITLPIGIGIGSDTDLAFGISSSLYGDEWSIPLELMTPTNVTGGIYMTGIRYHSKSGLFGEGLAGYVKAKNLQPADLGAGAGAGFQFVFTKDFGLALGSAVGVSGDGAWAVIYLGPTLLYHQRVAP